MKRNELKLKLITDAKKLESYIIATRRHIHAHPETLFEEENTARYIESELQKIGIRSTRIIKTGVLGEIQGSGKGKTIALRADIDALNVLENTDLPYQSKNTGKMHACGHDAHTAMLLGAAQILFKNRKHLEGSIKLIFQPAEEGGGGAKLIIDEGHFNDVDAIFGMHVWSPLPSGVIGIRKGPVFASSDRFKIDIIGKGGHAAAPHQTFDPTSVMVDIYNALQKLISREIDPFEPCVLSLPVFQASEAHNIIPKQAIIRGTLRSMNPNIRIFLRKRIVEVVEGYSSAWRCKGSVDFDPMAYPAVINDEMTVNTVIKILKGFGDVQIMNQSMVGEDFAFYLQESKGAFLTLGIRDESRGLIYPHHHPKFQVDESVLWKGTAAYSILGFYSFFEDEED
jgi:amidohydrolase